MPWWEFSVLPNRSRNNGSPALRAGDRGRGSKSSTVAPRHSSGGDRNFQLLSRFGLVAPECRPAQTAVEKLTGLLDGEQARKFVAWEANLPEVADTRGPVAERDAPF